MGVNDGTTPAASAKSTNVPGPRHEGSAALGASAKAPLRSLA